MRAAEDLDLIARAGAVIATNPSSNLHLRSGSRRSAKRCGAAAASRSASTPRRSMRTTTFCARCGSDISCTAAGVSNPIVERAPWLGGIVEHGRFANGAPGTGALKVGEPADVLVLDLDALDRDAVMPVEPIDLLFARACRAHVDALYVAGRAVVREGRLTGVDLDATEAKLRAQYRDGLASREAYLSAWSQLEPAAAAFYRGLVGCC